LREEKGRGKKRDALKGRKKQADVGWWELEKRDVRPRTINMGLGRKGKSSTGAL